jgi:hypothetical protein
MNKISSWLAIGVVVALASAWASAASIIDEGGDYSNTAAGASNVGIGGTTTFTGTIDPVAHGDEDYFSFTISKAITSIVIDNFVLVPEGNVAAFQVYAGLNANSTSPMPGGEILTGSVTGLALVGPLAAGDYTIYIRESNGTGTNPYSVTVNAVPLPAAVWLFGSALMGLTVVARRRKNTQISA